MTVTAQPAPRPTAGHVQVQVQVHVDGAVWAECQSCDVYVELDDGACLTAATDAFAACHSSTDTAGHSRLLPTGWRSPLSRWCALSQ